MARSEMRSKARLARAGVGPWPYRKLQKSLIEATKRASHHPANVAAHTHTCSIKCDKSRPAYGGRNRHRLSIASSIGVSFLYRMRGAWPV